MTPGVIDTNIWLYAANSDSDENPQARDFIKTAGRGPETFYVTEGILYEFLRVSTHSNVFDRPLTWSQSLEFLTPILSNRSFRLLTPSDRHWEVLESTLAELSHPSGNLFFDIRTAVLMREHGIKTVYTADRDFLQFSHITAIDPIQRA